jgi:deoxyribodipyrimidine photo-lyase
MTDTPLQRTFTDRAELIAYIQTTFADVVGDDEDVSDMRGGQAAASAALATIDPVRYAQTRNHLTGAVTGLSPYIRHGVLSLAQVRDAVLARVPRANDAEKLLNELAWRDYWQRVYAAIGDGIWYDREPYKTGHRADSYAKKLPDDVRAGETGLACIDGFVAELDSTGYLHNHARMWMAAYVVHWRRVRWQAGARWFLQHLLDGDPASNNLSWQWIASTFSHKPYFFNRENVQRYTNNMYCENCPLRTRCPFDAPYEVLAERLFDVPYEPRT